MHFLHRTENDRLFWFYEAVSMKLLSHLTYIDVVAKKGSIRKAAMSLNITSTALNRRILALEEEIGSPLFERLPNGVRLNTAGELLIEHIRKSISDLSRVTSKISDLSGIRAGHVTIAAGAEVVGTFLPRHMAHYRKEFPDVSFEILRRAPEEAMKSLRTFEADFALIFGPVPPSDYQILLSVDLPVMVAMGADHPLAQQDEVSFYDCANYPAILPADGSGLYDLLIATQRQKGLALREAIISESFELMAQYTAEEEAISFLLAFEEAKNTGTYRNLALRPLKASDAINGRLHIVQQKGRVLSVAAAKFAEQITQHISKAMPDSVY